MMAEGYPQAAEFRLNADKISDTFAKCEKICLHVGARLGDAIPNLSELGELFKSLSHFLESDEFCAANLKLRTVASDIAAIGRELSGESDGLVHLVKLNQAIATQIENLASNIRTIAALVFNVKIEAASFTGTADNMSDFVEGLQFLAKKAQLAVDKYQSTHTKLYELLQSTSKTQTAFQNGHQSRLLSVASEITESLDTISRRQRDMASALAEIGNQSQRIGLHSGQAVVALQIGDSTRQRIEHAHEALYLAADLLEPAKAAITLSSQGGASGHDVNSIAGGICHLQSLQLDAALSDFTQEMDTIEALLQGLAGDSRSLASQGLALFGSNGNGSDSFLEDLEKKLKAVSALVGEACQSRMIVDQAASAVGATMADMGTQTAGLSEIIVDMTMLGMNAVLKSTRLGQRGLGLNIIAQELRAYAVEIVRGVQALKPAIEKVATFVGQFSDTGEGGSADHMMELGGHMTGAMNTFKLSGAQMSEALTRLQGEAGSVRKTIDEAVVQLEGRNDISDTLLNAVASINALASLFSDPSQSDPASANVIDELLRNKYTMICERHIHENLVRSLGGNSGISWKNSNANSNAEPEESLEALLF